ncbi:MAG: LytTR family DNA-binding domain-containing protein [Sporocytophaga sp.]|nr:LytTR family DNA-binding domain-containing protein [Sporocytophaga sp.]
MLIKALIIDDEPSAIEVLKDIIKSFIADVEIAGTASSVPQAVAQIKKHNPDLIFLDIKLGNNTGFEILEQTSEMDYEVIFTTAYGEYRDKAFDHLALNYLTKPIDVDKLEKTIEKYKKRNQSLHSRDKLQELLASTRSNTNSKIPLSVRDGHILVSADEIIRCDADSNYSKVFLTDSRIITVAKTLKYFEENLPPSKFFRVHKSHLINIDFIEEIKNDGTLTLKNGGSVIISQRAKSLFFQFLNGSS